MVCCRPPRLHRSDRFALPEPFAACALDRGSRRGVRQTERTGRGQAQQTIRARGLTQVAIAVGSHIRPIAVTNSVAFTTASRSEPPATKRNPGPRADISQPSIVVTGGSRLTARAMHRVRTRAKFCSSASGAGLLPPRLLDSATTGRVRSPRRRRVTQRITPSHRLPAPRPNGLPVAPRGAFARNMRPAARSQPIRAASQQCDGSATLRDWYQRWRRSLKIRKRRGRSENLASAGLDQDSAPAEGLLCKTNPTAPLAARLVTGSASAACGRVRGTGDFRLWRPAGPVRRRRTAAPRRQQRELRSTPLPADARRSVVQGRRHAGPTGGHRVARSGRAAR